MISAFLLLCPVYLLLDIVALGNRVVYGTFEHRFIEDWSVYVERLLLLA